MSASIILFNILSKYKEKNYIDYNLYTFMLDLEKFGDICDE